MSLLLSPFPAIAVSRFGSLANAPKKVGAIGDSLSAEAWANNATTLSGIAFGFLSWVRFLSRQNIELTAANTFATSGYNTSEMVAAGYHISAAAARLDFVTICAGSNDPAEGISLSTTLANLSTMYSTVLASGALVVACPIPPRASQTEAVREHYGRVNQWIAKQAQADSRILFANYIPYLSDAEDAEGDPRSGYLRDGIHPYATGAYWMGKAVWNAMQPLVPNCDYLFSSPGDLYDATNNPTGNLLTNGILSGTTGTKGSNGVLSGDVAANWTMNGSSSGNKGTLEAVAAKIARTDGISAPWQQITLTQQPTGTFGMNFTQSPTFSQFSTGDVVELFAEVELDTGHSNCLGWQAQVFSTGPSLNVLDMHYGSATSPWPDPGETIRGVIRTQRFTVSSDTSAITVNIGLYTIGNVAADAVGRLGRVSLRKVVD